LTTAAVSTTEIRPSIIAKDARNPNSSPFGATSITRPLSQSRRTLATIVLTMVAVSARRSRQDVDPVGVTDR
jgi:hypothetical protein